MIDNGTIRRVVWLGSDGHHHAMDITRPGQAGRLLYALRQQGITDISQTWRVATEPASDGPEALEGLPRLAAIPATIAAMARVAAAGQAAR
jgi:hypothetical protein